jgi:phage tail P2-like protein
LPKDGYQNNEVTDWVTRWSGEELKAVATKLQSLHAYADPNLIDEEMLDYLAWLVGMADGYWDRQWQPDVKRKLISASHYLINHMGTTDAIRRVLDIHQIPYDIWVDGNLRVSFKLPGTFGRAKLRYYVRVPLSVSRKGKRWREVERTIKNYSAAVVSGKVTYKGFILNYSRLNDPLFKDTSRLV